MKTLLVIFSLGMTLLLSGCATKDKTNHDYAAFKESKPRSILVLLPKNKSPDINASHSFISEVTFPLAEAGYYVFPVAVVEETFKQNGLIHADEMNTASLAKLHQIFGADAVLYLNITEYGTSYQVIASDTRVTASARLVDARNAKTLWSGSATASSNEQQNNSGSGILSTLITAAITQISNTAFDKAHDVAAVTSVRLLAAGKPGGMLYGPRSPEYGKTVQ
jgi:hypothetical protein